MPTTHPHPSKKTRARRRRENDYVYVGKGSGWLEGWTSSTLREGGSAAFSGSGNIHPLHRGKEVSVLLPPPTSSMTHPLVCHTSAHWHTYMVCHTKYNPPIQIIQPSKTQGARGHINGGSYKGRGGGNLTGNPNKMMRDFLIEDTICLVQSTLNLAHCVAR